MHFILSNSIYFVALAFACQKFPPVLPLTPFREMNNFHHLAEQDFKEKKKTIVDSDSGAKSAELSGISSLGYNRSRSLRNGIVSVLTLIPI
jgi:hypothetical protein